jgi:hypothetical protein
LQTGDFSGVSDLVAFGVEKGLEFVEEAAKTSFLHLKIDLQANKCGSV